MAFLFCDSFDHYATADIGTKWSGSGTGGGGGSVQITAAQGRRGTSAFRLHTGFAGNPVAYLHRAVTPTTVGIMGFAVTVPSGSVGLDGMELAAFRDGSTSQVSLRVNNTGTFSVIRGGAFGTVLGTTTLAASVGIFNYIEWKVLIDPSVGTIDVRINGASALSLTAQNTRNTANSSYDGAALGAVDSISSGANGGDFAFYFDDFYLLNGLGAAPLNTFLGDVRVDACYPSGAGSNTGWTPSTGANYTCVDDTAPNGDTDYVSATTSPLTDTYAVQDAPVAGAPLYAVQLSINAKKSDAGTCTLAPIVRHSGTDNAGTTFNPGTGYSYNVTPYATNPGTGAAWTEAGFNAAEFGVRRTG